MFSLFSQKKNTKNKKTSVLLFKLISRSMNVENAILLALRLAICIIISNLLVMLQLILCLRIHCHGELFLQIFLGV